MVAGWQGCHHEIQHTDVGADPHHKYLHGDRPTMLIQNEVCAEKTTVHAMQLKFEMQNMLST